ncbi:DUF3081 domain-containing protein [Vibrio sp. S9_S30]|uniref:DUF3081 family protein n=1 Tax=Vibrio sp. S9_S30 TaxID=2720226 RepID=UPI001680790A|nr:DUF3081 family protein [Vibrio sp. S9_S30]MBD1557674.1 DUF3081 domain-containing protein [Vibrio sp. S9_S30]
MKNQLDILFVLTVLDKIRKSGRKSENGYVLEGVEARTGYDEYTVYLATPQVTLSIFFHNKYQIEYQKKEHLKSFMKSLEVINRNY